MRRFVQDFGGLDPGRDVDAIGAAALRAVPPRYNVALRKPAGILVSQDDDLVVTDAIWGLIPAWSKQFETPYSTQTARLERAPGSRIYRGAWRERRCAVPMSGYYKWDRSVKPAIPYYIHAGDGGPLFAAGLWERWSKDAPPRDSFAVLTHPNASIPSPLTPDGPVFLPYERVRDWIEGSAWFPQRFLARMRQPSLAAYAVSNAIRDPARDDYTLLEPRSATEADASSATRDDDFDDEPDDD